MVQLPHDPHSYAQPNEAVVTHQHLDLTVDFDSKTILGKTLLDVWNKNRKTVVFLDTKDLDISGVYLGDEHHPTAYSFVHEDPILGKALKISISSDEKQKVLIHYKTRPKSQAVQWLEPAQTAGKKFPFLFTQGQAILSRTWFPCQDSPGIRFSYSATVSVPNGLKPIMSAEKESKSKDGKFQFEMTKPIPAYLIALAVGNLEFKKIDERTGVYAEPEMLEKSAYEFADMGKMVAAAESLYGSYRWGRYDVLVLPPSFPFGGMENPCVTFATPTILAGDRSLTSLIAHELAHSWSGNLVTNSTWNDFWLNEGFTVYFERRIMEKLEGKDYADMLAVIGYEDLKGTLEDLKNDSSATCLKLNLAKNDPDDGMNDVAYEKGYLFLCHLEKLVGREKWDAFLKSYFDGHAFQSITTEQFVEYLENQLLIPNKIAKENWQINEWIYSPGLPTGTIAPQSSRFVSVEKLADQFSNTNSQLPKKEELKSWSSHEWLHFLRALPRNIGTKKMEKFDEAYQFTQSGNSEILFEWLNHSIQNDYKPAYPVLDHFLVNTGRRKFVLPLFKALVNKPLGKVRALDIYSRARKNYHSVTFQSVDQVLNVEK